LSGWKKGRELLWQLESIKRLKVIAANGTYKGQFVNNADLYD
jgi:hypothetical protein